MFCIGTQHSSNNNNNNNLQITYDRKVVRLHFYFIIFNGWQWINENYLIAQCLLTIIIVYIIIEAFLIEFIVDRIHVVWSKIVVFDLEAVICRV